MSDATSIELTGFTPNPNLRLFTTVLPEFPSVSLSIQSKLFHHDIKTEKSQT